MILFRVVKVRVRIQGDADCFRDQIVKESTLFWVPTAVRKNQAE